MPAPLKTCASNRKSAARHLLLLIAASALSLAPTCGKRKPPLAPIERIPQRTEELSGLQRGNQIILSWPAPRRNANEGSVQSIRRVDVYRVAENPRAPLPMTEDEFAVRATLVGSVTYDEIRKGEANLTYIDTLELSGEPGRLRYAVRYVNAAGQRAAFSNFFLMEPVAKVSEPPIIIKTGKEESEAALTISWDAPRKNIDDSAPVNLLGYDIYRTTVSQPGAGPKLLNQEPITSTQYQDKTFKFSEKYEYVVRSVSLGKEARQVESLDSNSISLAPEDKYPPSAPSLAPPGPAPGRLALFWSASPELDVAGYLLYRSTDPNLPKDRWTLLTPAAYTRTTFTDLNVESGKTYYYYVRAIDNAGNKSEPSEVVSETVP